MLRAIAALACALAAAGTVGATEHDKCTAEGASPAMPSVVFLRSYRASFNAPTRLAVDGEGNIYATDPGRGDIVVRAPDGRVLARARLGGAPVSVAVDSAPGRPYRIYIGDGQTGGVTAYDRAWRPVLELGQGAGEFLAVTDIAINAANGNVYVVDNQAHQVKIYSSAGTFVDSFGGRGTDAGFFNFPSGMFVDGARSEVLVVDPLNFWVQIFDLAGNFICRIGDTGGSRPGSIFGIRPRLFNVPQGVWVDAEGRIYVADAAEGRIHVVDRGGNSLGLIGAFGRRPGELRMPIDLVIDASGRLFIASSNNARLEVFGVDGFVDLEKFAPAEVTIEPDRFDHERGTVQFVAHIEVPGYSLEQIALDTITANGVPADLLSVAVTDHDGDTIPDLRVAFDGAALAATLPPEGEATITVQGQMATLGFNGFDIVAVTGGAVDSDGDGVLDADDACPDTVTGDVVDLQGCSIQQRCP
jgi:DNA-binding beta-propeller fold protein YncE